MSEDEILVQMSVNGRHVQRSVPHRLLLVDFLRYELKLTGTHVGCAHGVCGACTVLINGKTGRSCIALVAQMEGASIETVNLLLTEVRFRRSSRPFTSITPYNAAFARRAFS